MCVCVCVRACACVSSYQQGGRGEGEAGVLHTPVGEGGGQHQDVVLAPHVRPHQGLCRLQHVLSLRRGGAYTGSVTHPHVRLLNGGGIRAEWGQL